MLGILLVLQTFLPLQDSTKLRVVADSFHVPYSVVEAVAWMETRTGQRWNMLGPGVIDSVWSRGGTLAVRRHCREVGRFQLRPCINWVSRLGDRVCVTKNLYDYNIGIHCGIENLADMYMKYGSWIEVIKHQNGGGSRANDYLQKALAYLGWRSLSP